MKYLLFLFLLLTPPLLLADTSDFNINLLVGSDTISPSTPEFSSVTPVATTQINLSWGTSTDDYLLGGYVLLRDSNHLATTTLTSYIDSGLTASTTYTYEVYAFDSFFNLSSTSIAVATTTLSIPPVVATSTPTTSATVSPTTGSRSADAKSFSVTTGTQSAMFTWETYRPTKFILRWGRDEDYDGGYIVNEVYLTDHKTLINELEPGTKYYYELLAVNPSGSSFTISKGDFKTTSLVETATPENVRNLTATVKENDVALNWQSDYPVKIVRNSRFVPNDPYDGVLVFVGKAEDFLDRGALSTSPTQFYSVFAVGDDGSLSSGAVVRADRFSPGTIGSGSDKIDQEEIGKDSNETEVTIPEFNLADIKFFQDGSNFNFSEEKILFKADKPILFSIPKDSLPRHLKSILISLTDPSDPEKSQVFLVRLNKLGTAYEAVISPLGNAGYTKIKVEIFDYEKNTVGRYVKMATVLGDKGSEKVEVIFPDKIIRFSSYLVPIIVVLVSFFYWLYRRRGVKPTEDNL